MSGYEQSWGQNCTEIAPAIPHINGLSTLLRLATYRTVAQGLGTSIHYRAIQGITGILGAYFDALYPFKSRGFSAEVRLVIANTPPTQ